MRRVRIAAQLAACVLSASLAAQQNPGPADLAAALDRIGARLEQYYTRARSIVCVETVRLQPLGSGLAPDGFGRRLVYELRIAWEPGADGERPRDATVLRQIVAIDGKPPRPKDGSGCFNPMSPEPLAFLLSPRRPDYTFAWAGAARVDGRPSVMIDFKSAAKQPPEIVWNKECATIDVPGQSRGRLWIDAATDDVLRFDQHLIGTFEFSVPREHWRGGERTWVMERADSSIRFRPVNFHDPDETLVLPASIDSLTIVRNSATPRLRVTQEYSNYRRFVTGGRLVR